MREVSTALILEETVLVEEYRLTFETSDYGYFPRRLPMVPKLVFRIGLNFCFMASFSSFNRLMSSYPPF
jgi:hypothetical protein